MGNNRPVKTKDWIAYLKEQNCVYIRTHASHYIYECPNCLRPITFRESKKDIPAMHLKTNLFTLGKTLKELYEWIDKKPKK